MDIHDGSGIGEKAGGRKKIIRGGLLVGWLVRLLVGWLLGWLVGWLLVGCLAGWLLA